MHKIVIEEGLQEGMVHWGCYAKYEEKEEEESFLSR